MGYVKIYAGSFIIVQLISKNLEDCGITAVIKDETESARLAGLALQPMGIRKFLFTKVKKKKRLKY